MIFFADIEPLLILENFQELSSSNSSLSFGNVLTTLKGGEFSHLFETYLNNHFKKVNQSMRLNGHRVKGLYNVVAKEPSILWWHILQPSGGYFRQKISVFFNRIS